MEAHRKEDRIELFASEKAKPAQRPEGLGDKRLISGGGYTIVMQILGRYPLGEAIRRLPVRTGVVKLHQE